MRLANNDHRRYQIVSVFLFLLISACFYLKFSSYGLKGKYYKLDQQANSDAAAVFVASQTDRELFFPRDGDIQYIFTRKWNIARLGYPAEYPSYRVEWTGYLDVPGGESSEQVERKPGLWKATYQNRNFLGKPVDERADGALEVDDGTLGGRGHLRETSIEWLGQIEIAEEGEYAFQVSSDDGSWLFLNNQMLINNGGLHVDSPQAGRIRLTPGHHDFRVRYFDAGGNHRFRLMWLPPGAGEFSAIPPELLTHAPNQGYSLVVESNRPFSVNLAGTPMVEGTSLAGDTFFSKTLPSGMQPVQVVFESVLYGGSFQLKWRTPDGEYKVVPSCHLRTPDAWTHVLALGLLLTIIILGVLGIISWFFPIFCSQFNRDFVQFVKLRWVTHTLAVIVILGASLRFYQYDIIPTFLDTVDEYMEGWPGWNLIHKGIPRGWVSAAATRDFVDIRWFSNTLSISDWGFHPPPLFPFFIGLSATLGGARDMYEVSLSHLRIPPILFSILSIIVVFMLAKRLYGSAAALFASLIYATFPVAVVSARLAKSENLLALISLCSTYKVLQYIERKKRSDLITAGLFCALAMMTKEIGFYVTISCIAILGPHTRFRDSVFIGLMGVLGLACYYFYGWSQNWAVFLDTLKAYSAFGSAFDQIVDTFRAARVTGAEVGSGWMIWLWCTVAYAYLARRQEALIPLVVYIFALSITHIGAGSYGWYWIPLYPYFAITAGLFLRDFLISADLPRAMLMLLPAIVTSISVFYQYYSDVPPAPLLVRLTIACLSLPFFVGQVFKQRFFLSLRRVSAGIYILLFVGLNIEIVLHFIRIYSRFG